MKVFKILTFLAAFAAISIGCTEEPDPVIISFIEASGTSFGDGSAVTKNLNGASSAEDVPLNAIITVTFDKEIDATTVNSTNVTMFNDAGSIEITINASGTVMTIEPVSDLLRGTLYTVSFANLKATDEAIFNTALRTFTTEGRAPVVVPNADAMLAYWPFDNDPNDFTGNFPSDKVVAITYGTDRFELGNSVATFDGDQSIIEVPNADQFMAGDDFTLSFWMKTNSTDHVDADGNPSNHFVLGLAAFKGFQFEVPADFNSCKLACQYGLPDGTTTAEDTWFPGNGEDKDNGGWQGWDFAADLTASGGVPSLLQDKWAHIICTYNATAKQSRMYINGELMKSFDFNLWPEGDPKKEVTGVAYGGLEPSELPVLAFGFIHSSGGTLWDTEPWGNYDLPTSNHFKGALDDVRIFSAAYSASDAKDLYDAEKN